MKSFKLNKKIIQRPDVSFEAKGLYAYIISVNLKNISFNEIKRKTCEEFDHLRAICRELERFGYVEIIESKTDLLLRLAEVDND